VSWFRSAANPETFNRRFTSSWRKNSGQRRDPREDRLVVDTLTARQRSKCMAAIRGKDATPERLVRSVLHRLGCRFSLHRTDLPGKPDIVMPARRSIILIHGCYWHSHTCKRGCSTPVSNAPFWKKKRNGIIIRDRRTLEALRRDGWRVLVIWECQTRYKFRIVTRLSKFLKL